MINIFQGPTAREMHAFLQFKRSLGYGYMRAEFTLREFDRFLIQYAANNRRLKLDRAAIAWRRASRAESPAACPPMPRCCGSSTDTYADHPNQGL
jgi:hypothetical protein